MHGSSQFVWIAFWHDVVAAQILVQQNSVPFEKQP
jgi:hypothetical protein